jgi:hypothetical protein
MEYKGNWSAATNTPTLADGAGNNGDVYYVTAAGTVDFGSGNITFAIGDRVVYSGTGSVWQKWDSSDAVTSVNSLTGAVTLDTDDIGEGSNNLYFTDSRARTAVITQNIADGVTDRAPSEDAVYDALAGKSNTGHTHVAANITDFASAAKSAAVADSITDSVTDVAPSQNAVFDALAGKLSLSGGTMTGDLLVSGSVNIGATGSAVANIVVLDLIDSTGLGSLSVEQRELRDATNGVTLDWNQRKLMVPNDFGAVTAGTWGTSFASNEEPDFLGGDYVFLDMGGSGRLYGLLSPTANDHAATKGYVDTGLSGKANTSHTHVAADITDFASAAKSATVADSISDSVTDVAPSQNAVFDALAGKLANVVEDTSPELGGNLEVGANAIEAASNPVLLAGQNSVRRAKQASKTSFVEEEYIHGITLSGSQTNTVISALTFAHATFEGMEITYKIKQSTSNNVRIGTIRVVTNGTAVVLNDVFTDSADLEMDFSAVVNGANIDIRYSSGTNGGTMRADVKKFLA